MNSPKWRDHKDHLKLIVETALNAVNPSDTVKQFLREKDGLVLVGSNEFTLGEEGRIYVVGAGKAGVLMAEAVEVVLGDHITDGVLAVPNLPKQALSKIRFIEAGHPLPSEGSLEAGVQIAALLAETREGDLVLVLISGGGSALLELPREGLQLSDLQQVNDLLLKSGATIHQVNKVRRQMSRIKGGGLAKMASPAQTAALILSDIVGDQLEAIASGPTVSSQSTAKDGWEVLEKFNLLSRVPSAVVEVLRRAMGEDEGDSESPFEALNVIVGSNRIAAEAATNTANDLGFRTILMTTKLQGEARIIGHQIAHLVKALMISSRSDEPICLIFGGETTVTVRGDGIGGRNQEMALAMAVELDGEENIAVITLATDGIDGPTPSAGAIVTGDTIARSRAMGLDASSSLADNDSYTFFHKLGDELNMGLTGTNVNDLIIACVYAS
jgi:hydroxypyruvate reductase